MIINSLSTHKFYFSFPPNTDLILLSRRMAIVVVKGEGPRSGCTACPDTGLRSLVLGVMDPPVQDGGHWRIEKGKP